MGMRSKSRSRKAAAGNALSGVQAALELVFRAIGHVAQITAVVAGLSLLMPGLGHVAIHKFRRGAIVALPALAVTFVVLLLVIFDRSALFQIVSGAGGAPLGSKIITAPITRRGHTFISFCRDVGR